MTINDLISRGIGIYTPLKIEVAVMDKNNCYKFIENALDDGVELIFSEDGLLLNEAILHLKILE